MMESHGQQDQARLDSRPGSQGEANASTSAQGRPDSSGFPTARTWVLLLGAGIAAGVCSALATEGVLRAFRPSLMPRMKAMPTTQDARLLTAARVSSGALAFAAMGGLLGIALGLAGGAARRSPAAGGAAGAVGLLAGSAIAGAVAWTVLSLVYGRVDPQSQDLVIPLLYHEALWSLAGAVCGLAFGLGAGGRTRWIRTAIGGWVGAAVATVIYEMVGALVFPTHRTQLPLAGSAETRALAAILVGLGAAIGIALAAGEPEEKPTRSESRN
jgi:hypothetical protein